MYSSLKTKRESLINELKEYKNKKNNCLICKGIGTIPKEMKNPFTSISSEMIIRNILCECAKDENGEIIQEDEIINELYYLDDKIKSIPLEYEDANIDKSPIKNQIIDFIRSKELFVAWVHGMTGSGKTMLAYALKSYSMVNQLIWIKIIKDYKLLDEFNDNKNFMNDKCILIIDDIGAITAKGLADYYIDVYHRIIDYRRENKLKTIFTSNISINDWCKWTEEIDNLKSNRIISRLSGISIDIKMPDKDYRKL